MKPEMIDGLPFYTPTRDWRNVMKIGSLIEELIQLKKSYKIRYPDDESINLACNVLERFQNQQMPVSDAIEKIETKERENPLLSKEDFAKYLDKLRDADDLCDKIDKLMRESRENIDNDFMNGSSLQINHKDIVIELLSKLMHDEGDIDYFVYELNYGREYEHGMITDTDGTDVDFSTSEKLYDYLAAHY